MHHARWSVSRSSVFRSSLSLRLAISIFVKAACFASILGITLHPHECRDSQENVPAMLGKDAIGRRQLVEHANTLALRSGNWKYIEPAPGPARTQSTSVETGMNKQPQLYDLNSDPQEQNDLASRFPKKIAELKETLQKIKAAG